MVSGFALPLYLVIAVISTLALTLMLPKPFYLPAGKLCVFTKTNALARTVVNTMAGTIGTSVMHLSALSRPPSGAQFAADLTCKMASPDQLLRQVAADTVISSCSGDVHNAHSASIRLL